MIRQSLHPQPLATWSSLLILLLMIAVIVMVGNDMQRSDALQLALDQATERQQQQQSHPLQLEASAWEAFARKNPDLLPQLDKLGRLLVPKLFLLMMQLGDNGGIRLKIKTDTLDKAFVFVDRLRAHGYVAVISQAQKTPPSAGDAGLVITINIEASQP